MWAAQSLNLKKSQRFLTQGEMASIGSALPMAIGATFAQPDKTIIVITGDGGFQLNIHELQTIYNHNLPIKIILLNNDSYGMIRQFQEQYSDCIFQSTGKGYSCTNFQNVVNAYEIESTKISSNHEIINAFEYLFASDGPSFLEIAIDANQKVLPKLSVSILLEDQEPFLPFYELKSKRIIDFLERNIENESYK